MVWTFHAWRLDGEGGQTFLAGDLPLSDVSITRTLSGVDGIEATVPVQVGRLRGGGPTDSVFVPWSTAVYAEEDGAIRAGGIVTAADSVGPKLALTVEGFTAYLHGLPYAGESQFVQADPLRIARHIWDHAQAQPGGDLGLEVTTSPEAGSPVRVGQLPVEQWPKYTDGAQVPTLPVEGVQFVYQWVTTTSTGTTRTTTQYGRATRTYTPATATTSCILRNRTTRVVTQDDGTSLPAGWEVLGVLTSTAAPKKTEEGETLEPYKLEWFSDFDLGARFDDLGKLGGFDWVEGHAWDGDEVRHTLRIGWPRIGRVRTDVRFVVGENVTVEPTLEVEGDRWADEVIMLGAGEGRAMVRGSWAGDRTRLRRPKVLTDKTIRSASVASRAAAREWRAYQADTDVKAITVMDHPNAPLGSWEPGDTVRLLGSGSGWAADLDMQVRVLSTTFSPGGATASLTVTRADGGSR